MRTEEQVLRVPHQLGVGLTIFFISGGNPHLTSRFCGVVLGPTTISNMTSEPLHDSLSHLLSGFRYQATRHLCSRFRCAILSVRGCVKSPTSVRSWPDNLFISGGNPHLTNRFCGIVLGLTTISNPYSYQDVKKKSTVDLEIWWIDFCANLILEFSRLFSPF
ncbi:hypothetical protein MtrunA17_Chr5g0429981 [Medicago truncatula]|uniref:Uncharacterized protein n=1 Tax=Medicago truncatula TaxID=3880 RepID=A0A396HWZ0_MEDTR|nr:hypothetical protein MtrunA17_Chr5g0429981 [Medicago truncatula]